MSANKKAQEEWTVNDYSIQKVIGEGSYGRALLATDNRNGQLIVVKEISFANLTEQERNDARKETMILSLLNHPNIIGYRGSFLDKNIFHIIMDYADGGDLAEQIENATEHFDEDKILNWFVQICLAIKHIHDRKILHRDLKTQNVFLMRNGTVKLGDFGIAKVLDHTTSFAKTSIGTPYYLSPEICLGRKYNAKSDIWSLGCILYEMCTLKHPFDASSINGLIMKITKSKQAPIPRQYSAKLRSLVDTLLAKQPPKRPSINEILNIDFIQAKIGSLLNSTLRKIEFSHTVFHGVKGGITPEIKTDDDPKESKAQPAAAAPAPAPKKPISRLPTKKPPTASKGSRSPVSTASSSTPKNSPSTTSVSKNPTGVKSPSRVPVKHSSASSSGGISSGSRPSTNSGSRNMSSSNSMKISKEAAAAAQAEREAQKERREQEQAAKKQREELDEKKRQEAMKKRKESGNAQKNRLEQLRKEEAERQKKYKNLEAPFKKVRQNMETTSNANSSSNAPATKNEKERTKRPGTGGKNREKEIASLHEMIKQKKAEAAKMGKKAGDTIQIGSMTFDISGPIESNESQKSNTAEVEKKPPMRIEDLIYEMPGDDEDDDDLVSLAVIAQNMQDHPPSDEENDEDEDEEDDMAAAARKYLFKGKPVEISKSDGSITASVRKFIVKGIGEEKLNSVYHLVKDQSEHLTEDQVDEELKKILKTDEEMEYYPLVQQLVVDETLVNEY